MARILVGISGWTYPPWRGNFYPPSLPQTLELSYAARRFGALEVNGTFYSLQRPSTFSAWYEQSPPGFVFALKGGRFITHMRKLREPLAPMANFFASGLLCLREKLGPILWQFPPQFAFDADRFRAFFDLLPRDTLELARLARKHDHRVRSRVFLDAHARRPVRHAVEFRHTSFLCDAFIAMLREYGISLVIADVASRFPTAEDLTTNWAYIRLHGSRKLYASGYMPREIEAWAGRIETWHAGREPIDARCVGSPARRARVGRDVYVFFDNTDVKLRAPVDARRMAERLGVGPFESTREVLQALGVRPGRRPASRE